ncbi:DUF11 domain-containing protein [Micromonospora phytophila]|uniref:DUF11 domain-containing protein n=1 Tax=Micromonospora phytophila TaxID=709888 RepID=UPI00202F55F4|nr:DUF11 domain-containing protein [Micromonospora phytophila]MCM0675250.1 DUF11 domain-containing protein [Micromonospora phytophila]
MSPARRYRLAARLALGALGALAVATVSATPALAAPSRADLTVTVSANPTTVVDVGGGVAVQVDVRNVGTRAAANVILQHALPPGAYFSDGNSIPAGWQCDLRTTLACTHGSLAAGATAPRLIFYVSFPGGPIGDTATFTTTASTTSNELSLANNTGQATVSYIRGVTDVAVNQVWAPTQAQVGDTVEIGIDVANNGNMTAQEVYVTVPLPAGFTRQSESASSPWYCDFVDDPALGGPEWRCTLYQLVDGWQADTLYLTATVTSGTPGDSVPVTVTASTNSPEDNLGDNSAQTSIAIV